MLSISDDPLSLPLSQAADTLYALTNMLRYELAPSRLENPSNYSRLPPVLTIETWAMLTASIDGGECAKKPDWSH